MKLGPIAAALGGGVAGLAMTGNGGALMGLSPLLALLKGKKKKKDEAAPADPQVVPAPTAPPNGTAALAQNPMAKNLKQQQIARALLQFGGQQSNPFGQQY